MAFKRDWRALTLPKCGEKYSIRKLQGLDWSMTTGIIPDQDDFVPKVEGRSVTVKDYKPEVIKYNVEMVCRSIVSAPKGLLLWPLEPGPSMPSGHISFYELEEEDQMFLFTEVFSLAGEGAISGNAERFSEKQDPRDASLPDSPSVPVPTN